MVDRSVMGLFDLAIFITVAVGERQHAFHKFGAIRPLGVHAYVHILLARCMLAVVGLSCSFGRIRSYFTQGRQPLIFQSSCYRARPCGYRQRNAIVKPNKKAWGTIVLQSFFLFSFCESIVLQSYFPGSNHACHPNVQIL
jgi:hypothetical protein